VRPKRRFPCAARGRSGRPTARAQPTRPARPRARSAAPAGRALIEPRAAPVSRRKYSLPPGRRGSSRHPSRLRSTPRSRIVCTVPGSTVAAQPPSFILHTRSSGAAAVRFSRSPWSPTPCAPHASPSCAPTRTCRGSDTCPSSWQCTPIEQSAFPPSRSRDSTGGASRATAPRSCAAEEVPVLPALAAQMNVTASNFASASFPRAPRASRARAEEEERRRVDRQAVVKRLRPRDAHPVEDLPLEPELPAGVFSS